MFDLMYWFQCACFANMILMVSAFHVEHITLNQSLNGWYANNVTVDFTNFMTDGWDYQGGTKAYHLETDTFWLLHDNDIFIWNLSIFQNAASVVYYPNAINTSSDLFDSVINNNGIFINNTMYFACCYSTTLSGASYLGSFNIDTYEFNDKVSFIPYGPMYAACVLTNRDNTQIYLLSGSDSDNSNQFYIYIISNDTWIKGPDYNYPRHRPSCVINDYNWDESIKNDEYIYLLLGEESNIERINVNQDWSSNSNSIESITWETIDPTLINLCMIPGEFGECCGDILYTSAVSIENLIYLIGGICTADVSKSLINSVAYIDLFTSSVGISTDFVFGEISGAMARYSPKQDKIFVMFGCYTWDYFRFYKGLYYSSNISTNTFINRIDTDTPSSLPTSIPSSIPTSVPTNIPTSTPTSIPTTSSTNTPVDSDDGSILNNNRQIIALWSNVGTYLVFGSFIICLVMILGSYYRFYVAYNKSVDLFDIIAVCRFVQNCSDFWTDIIFAIVLYFDKNNYSNRYNDNYNLFWFSIAFIIIPYIYSCVSAIYWIYKWNNCKNDFPIRLKTYLDRYQFLILLLTMFAGFYVTVDLMRSKLFYKKIFYLPLKKKEYDALKYHRFINLFMLENLPQFIIQILYLTLNKNDNVIYVPIVFITLILTTISLLFTIFKIIFIIVGNCDTKLNRDATTYQECSIKGQFLIEGDEINIGKEYHSFHGKKMQLCLTQILDDCVHEKNHKWSENINKDIFYQIECFYIENKFLLRQLIIYFELIVYVNISSCNNKKIIYQIVDSVKEDMDTILTPKKTFNKKLVASIGKVCRIDDKLVVRKISHLDLSSTVSHDEAIVKQRIRSMSKNEKLVVELAK